MQIVKMWKSDSGNVFNSLKEAEEDELRYILGKIIQKNTYQGETEASDVIDDILRTFRLTKL